MTDYTGTVDPSKRGVGCGVDGGTGFTVDVRGTRIVGGSPRKFHITLRDEDQSALPAHGSTVTVSVT